MSAEKRLHKSDAVINLIELETRFNRQQFVLLKCSAHSTDTNVTIEFLTLHVEKRNVHAARIQKGDKQESLH